MLEDRCCFNNWQREKCCCNNCQKENCCFKMCEKKQKPMYANCECKFDMKMPMQNYDMGCYQKQMW